MRIERSVDVAASASEVFALVDDLAAYPSWMALVHAVSAVDAADDVPTWEVELRAQVGPVARSKRLRMRRSVHEPDHRAVFERAEVDGRAHSPWVLDARVRDLPGGGARVTMMLTYGGSLWSGAVLERVLDDHVERGGEALRARCANAADRPATDS